MDGLPHNLSGAGALRNGIRPISRAETSGSGMPLMLPQRDELEKVTRKIGEVEGALAGNHNYLGINDTSLLIKELHSLRKKEEQIRDLQLLLLKSMGPRLALAGATSVMPHQLVGGGGGGDGAFFTGSYASQQVATAGSLRATNVLGPPGPRQSQTASNRSGDGGDPNSTGVGKGANASYEANGVVDAEGGAKRKRVSAADAEKSGGRMEGSSMEGLPQSPVPSAAFSSQRYEEDGGGGCGEDAGQNAPEDHDSAGMVTTTAGGSLSDHGGAVPIHLDVVIVANGGKSKRSGEVWRVTPCREAGCTKRPSFGKAGDAKATYCGAHKLKGMMLVNRRRRCSEEGCSRQPLYGTDSDRVPLACGAHKSPEYVNVTHRRCAEAGCTTQPVYGDAPVADGDKFCPQFCAGHKRTGMVSQKRTRCAAIRCNRRAAYGMPGGEIKFCAEHKVGEMVKITQLQGPRPATCSHDSQDVTSSSAQQQQSSSTEPAAASEGYGSNDHRDVDVVGNSPRKGEAARSSVNVQSSCPSQQQAPPPPSPAAAPILSATSGVESTSQSRQDSDFPNGATSLSVGAANSATGGAVSGLAGKNNGSGNRIGNNGRDGGGGEVKEEAERSSAASCNYDVRRESKVGECSGGGVGCGGNPGRLPSPPQQQQQLQLRHPSLLRDSLPPLPPPLQPPPHGPLALPIPNQQSGRQGRMSSAVGVGGVAGSGEGSDDLSSHHHIHFQQQLQQQQQQHQRQHQQMEHYRNQHMQQHQQQQQQQQPPQQVQQQHQHLQQQQLPPLGAAHSGVLLPPLPLHQMDHQLVTFPAPMQGSMTHPVALLSHASGSSIVRGDQGGGMGFRDS